VLLSEAITISAALAQRPAAASICGLYSMLFRLSAVQTTASPLAPLNRASHIVDRRRQARAPLHTFVRHHPRMVPASASCVSAAPRTLAALLCQCCSDAPLLVLSVPRHKPTTPKSRVRPFIKETVVHVLFLATCMQETHRTTLEPQPAPAILSHSIVHAHPSPLKASIIIFFDFPPTTPCIERMQASCTPHPWLAGSSLARRLSDDCCARLRCCSHSINQLLVASIPVARIAF
jgi:hypothetical protein